MQVQGLSQHHQLVGGVEGGVAGVILEGECGGVVVSALVSGCLELRARKSQVCENLPCICDRGIIVLPDTA